MADSQINSSVQDCGHELLLLMTDTAANGAVKVSPVGVFAEVLLLKIHRR
jgi:hypothetical protein